MKNIVLIDFTDESIHALSYAVEFSKSINAKLELVNVGSISDFAHSIRRLEDLKYRFSTPKFQIEINELYGNLAEEVPRYVEEEKIGFIFCGTHDLKFTEHFFSSRILKLMNHSKSNFIFIPKTLKAYRPVKHVLAPILVDTHSLQKLEVLRYLRTFMNFDLTLCTYNDTTNLLKQTLFIAKKILNKAKIPYTIDYLGNSEEEFRRMVDEYADSIGVDMISIVNLTEIHLFNFGSKGFVEDLIRNEHQIPIMAVQNQALTDYSSFHTVGGY